MLTKLIYLISIKNKNIRIAPLASFRGGGRLPACLSVPLVVGSFASPPWIIKKGKGHKALAFGAVGSSPTYRKAVAALL